MKIRKPKRMIVLFFVAALIGVLFYILSLDVYGAEPSGERLARMKQSKHFKNGTFQNLSYTPALADGYTMPKVMYDFLFGKKDIHLNPQKDIPVVKTDFKTISKDEELFIWLGHSSYFIQTNGVSFLIDPVLSSYGSPFKFGNKAFKGSDYFTPEMIPNVDYLVITHDHYDHLDYPTVKSLKDRVSKVILPLGVGAHFEKWGFAPNQLIEEEWGSSVELMNDITITFTPARHFSGRKFKRNNTLWTSYVLKSPTSNIFLGGDSGYDTHFKSIGEKYGPFDYAVMENGQYNEAWHYIHTLPEETVKASIDINAKKIIPVHYGKFALAKHAWFEPMEEFSKLGSQQNLSILMPKMGEVVYLNQPDQKFDVWWK